ncbi:hypothetical protein L596_028959 [Steinernema carpocapsae]|uniref:Uncharacterized protein n=1 Tax=Steinernema carpocapsae TaxID=34508 RepID=A0A4U5LT82_STECR|nr:hypothetical protein L596_028959 [Steinernema carpocapsae]
MRSWIQNCPRGSKPNLWEDELCGSIDKPGITGCWYTYILPKIVPDLTFGMEASVKNASFMAASVSCVPLAHCNVSGLVPCPRRTSISSDGRSGLFSLESVYSLNFLIAS